MAVRWISGFDLLSFKEAKDIVTSEDYTKFYDLMYDIGFDINKDFEFEEKYCRSMLDHKVICLGRWVGVERIDKEWVGSPYCTLENRIEMAGTRDGSLMLEMSAMCNVPNFTGMLVKSLEDEFGKETEYEFADEEDAIFEMIRESSKYKNNIGEIQ